VSGDLHVTGFVTDDPNINLVKFFYERIGARAQFNKLDLNSLDVGKTLTATMEIPTEHAAICKNGQFTVTLGHNAADLFNSSAILDIDNNPPLRPGTLNITVEDDASRCPGLAIKQNAALERDGVKEGGSFDLQLRRTNDFSGKVKFEYRVDGDPKLDFLASAQEGRKSLNQGKVTPVNNRHDFSAGTVQTQLDPSTGNGAVKITLLESDYYKLPAKKTLTVPVKDDTDYATRVLLIQDLTVAEDHWYPRSMKLGWYNKRLPEPIRIKYFRENLMNDQYHEGDETLCVRFDQPKFLRLPGGVKEYFATVTITDDDPAPIIKVDAPSAAEGDGTLDFTVTLTNPPQGKDVTVKYHDTRKGSATSEADYEALPTASAKGVLTFQADQGDAPQEKTISVQITDDTEVEEEPFPPVKAGSGSRCPPSPT